MISYSTGHGRLQFGNGSYINTVFILPLTESCTIATVVKMCSPLWHGSVCVLVGSVYSSHAETDAVV